MQGDFFMSDHIFDRDFNELLLAQLSEDQDIQHLIDRATEYLQNPLMVIDARFRVLYASRHISIDIPLWNTSVNEHFVTDGIISSMEKNELINKIRNGKGSAFISDLPNGHKALRVPLFYQGKCCGFVGTYDYIRPFSDKDEGAMHSLVRAITILYTADPDILGALDNSRDDYFLELIKCGTREMAEILTQRNRAFQLGPEKLLVCLTRRVEGMAVENVAFGRLRDYLRSGIYPHVSAIYKHHLVLLFTLQKTTDVTRRSILSAIEESCQKYDLHAGLSLSFDEDAFIPLAYKQALKASLYADPDDTALPHIGSYEHYMVKDILNASLRFYPASMYEHPIIHKLAAYDIEYGTKYLETLRLYLDNLCNMKATAAQMEVHYNTIKYRLSIIEEIGNCDLRSDPELLLRLIISLRIRDFADNHHVPEKPEGKKKNELPESDSSH